MYSEIHQKSKVSEMSKNNKLKAFIEGEPIRDVIRSKESEEPKSSKESDLDALRAKMNALSFEETEDRSFAELPENVKEDIQRQSVQMQDALSADAERAKALRARRIQNMSVQRSKPEIRGLSTAEVNDRRRRGQINRAEEDNTRTVGYIVRKNVFTYFNLIFIILAALLISVGEFKNLLFLLVVIANTGIGIVQELRSKKAVDDLSILAEQSVNVLRDGKWFGTASSQLVLDDVVEFATGIQICADAVVLSGECNVNEALLTGETDAIPKGAGEELKSGSTVINGKVIARLTAVGSDSYAAELTKKAKTGASAGKSEMMASLDKLIKAIGILLIPVGIALFARQYFYLHMEFADTIVSTVAALIGMIPEGLYLLTSVALALAVLRLSRQKVLVRDMSCVETLARVDTLCVDKTGTITEPGMDVQELLTLNEEIYTKEQLEEMLCAFYKNMEADNETAKAVEAACKDAPLKHPWKATQVIPFSSDWKWSGVAFDGVGTFLLGAPEFLMEHRAYELDETVKPYAEKGLRVLLIAYMTENVPMTRKGVPELNPNSITPLGIICLSNRLREGAADTFRYFAEQDVTVKVISGDNPVTVSEVAKQACIPNAEDYIDATTLQTDEDIAEAVQTYTVFGRVTPQQKLAFVKALQADGHTVAMTGDGVNDVLALKEANCGIAMSGGAQAASQIANLVLLENDFSAMPGIVNEGRQVINNIQRSASLFLVKNIFSFVFALISIFAGFSYPLQPNQLSMISALTIGIPAFFLAMQPNNKRIEGHFLPNVFYRAAPGGLCDVLLILGISLFFYAFHLPDDLLYTVSAITMLMVGIIVLYTICTPMDKFRWIVWGADLAAAILVITLSPYIPILSSYLEMTPLTFQAALILVVFLLLAYPTMRALLWSRLYLHKLWAYLLEKMGKEPKVKVPEKSNLSS